MRKEKKFNAKSAKDEDFDFGDDFSDDFGELGSPKDDRNAATKFTGGALKGAKDRIKDPELYKEIIKKNMPAGYGRLIDTGEASLDQISKLHSEVTKALKPLAQDTKRTIKVMQPVVDKLLPDTIASKLKAWTEGDNKYRVDEEAAKEAGVQGQLNDIFAKQADIQETARKEDIARDELKSGEERLRHKDILGQLTSASESVNRLAQYQDTVTFQYQRKSLEYQIRSYMLQSEDSRRNQEFMETQRRAMEDIIKNTGLPDFVKMRSTEVMRQAMRNKFYNSIGGNLLGKTGQRFIQDAGAALRRKVKESITSAVDGISMGLQGATMAAESAQEMGIDFTELGGELGGSMATDSIAQWVAKKVGGFAKKNAPGLTGKTRALGNKASSFLDEARIATKKASRKEYNELGWAGKLAKLLYPGEEYRDTSLETFNYKSIEEPAIFNVKARLSITEAIPGYLSRILREQQIQRTGDKNIGLIRYDYKSNSFMGDQELKGRMFEELMGGNSMESMRSSSDRMLDDDIGKKLPQNVKDAHHRAMIEFRRRGDVSVADYAKEDTWAGTAAKPYAKILAAVYRKKLQLKDGEDWGGTKKLHSASQEAEYAKLVKLSQQVGGYLTVDMEKVNAMMKDAVGRKMLEEAGLVKDGVFDEEAYIEYINEQRKYNPTGGIHLAAENPYHISMTGKKSKKASRGQYSDNTRYPDAIGKLEKGSASPSLGPSNVTMDFKEITQSIEDWSAKPASEKMVDLLGKILATNEEHLMATLGQYESIGGDNPQGPRKKRWYNKTVGEAIGDVGSLLRKGVSRTFGAAWGLTKGVYHIAKKGVLGSASGAVKSWNFVKNWKKEVADVWVKGELQPRISAVKMKAGKYRDEVTGKIIYGWQDIKGKVRDMDTGEIIEFTKEELSKLEVKFPFLTKVRKGAWWLLKNGITGAAKLGLKATIGIPKKLIGYGKKLNNAAMDVFFGKYDDVYRADNMDSPLVKGSSIREGRLFHLDGAGGKAEQVKSSYDIQGPCVWSNGDSAISADDIHAGLVNKDGKALIKPSELLKLKARAGLNMLKNGATWGLRKVKDVAMYGVKGVKSFFSDIFGAGGFVVATRKTNEYLEDIRDMIAKKWKFKIKDRTLGTDKVKNDDSSKTGALKKKMSHWLAESKIKAKNRHDEFKRRKPGWLGDKIGKMKGSMMDKLKAAFTNSDGSEEGKGGGGNILEALLEYFGIKKLLGKVGGKGIAGRLLGWLLGTGGEAAAGGVAAGAEAAGAAAIGTEAAAAAGGAAATGGAVAGAAATEAAVTGAAATAGGLLGLPALLTAAVVGLAGYGAYKGYKWITSKTLTPLDKLRFAQYGVAKNESHMQDLVKFEEYMEPQIVYDGPEVYVKKDNFSLEKAMDFFGLEFTKKKDIDRFAGWFNARFLPVMGGWLQAVSSISGGRVKSLSALDKLNKETQLKVYALVAKVKGNFNWQLSPWNSDKSWFGKDTMLDCVGDDLKPIMDSVRKEIEALTDDGKNPKSVGEALTGGLSKLTGAKDANASELPGAKPGGMSLSNKVGDAQGRVIKQSASTQVSVTSGGSVWAKRDVAGYMRSIRVRCYGLDNPKQAQVEQLLTLEQAVSSKIIFKGPYASFSGTVDHIFETYGTIFGNVNKDSKDAGNFVLWFLNRFLPVYLAAKNAIARYLNNTTISVDDGLEKLKAHDKYIAAGMMIAGRKDDKENNYWVIRVTPWPGVVGGNSSDGLNPFVNAVKAEADKETANEKKPGGQQPAAKTPTQTAGNKGLDSSGFGGYISAAPGSGQNVSVNSGGTGAQPGSAKDSVPDNAVGQITNGGGSMPPLPSNAQPVMAADSARRLAKSQSTGRCAHYVSDALEAAGYRFRRPAAAYQFESDGTLASLGFQQIAANSPSQVGDIMVYGKSAKHKYGHVQIYDGTNWISDFVQRTDKPYRDNLPVTKWRDGRYLTGGRSVSAEAKVVGNNGFGQSGAERLKTEIKNGANAQEKQSLQRLQQPEGYNPANQPNQPAKNGGNPGTPNPMGGGVQKAAITDGTNQGTGTYASIPKPNGSGPAAFKDMYMAISKATGVPVTVLAAMTAVESGFRASVGSNSSSASGLMQFTSGTWAEMLSKYGKKFGIPQGARREDAVANVLMGAMYAKENAGGKAVTPVDLYVKHLLGGPGGSRFLRALAQNPNQPVTSAVEAKQIAGNKPFFFTSGGPMTVQQSYETMSANLTRKYNDFKLAPIYGSFGSAGSATFGTGTGGDGNGGSSSSAPATTGWDGSTPIDGYVSASMGGAAPKVTMYDGSATQADGSSSGGKGGNTESAKAVDSLVSAAEGVAGLFGDNKKELDTTNGVKSADGTGVIGKIGRRSNSQGDPFGDVKGNDSASGKNGSSQGANANDPFAAISEKIKGIGGGITNAVNSIGRASDIFGGVKPVSSGQKQPEDHLSTLANNAGDMYGELRKHTALLDRIASGVDTIAGTKTTTKPVAKEEPASDKGKVVDTGKVDKDNSSIGASYTNAMKFNPVLDFARRI